MTNIVKAYYLLYYRMYNSALSHSDGYNLESFSASSIALLSFAFIYSSLFTWLNVITENLLKEFTPKWLFVLMLFILAVYHNYTFVIDERWREYQTEFDSYSNQKNKKISWYIILYFILIILNLFIAMHYQIKLNESLGKVPN